MPSQVHRGISLFTPSPFGEGWGEAFFPHSVLLKYNGVSRLLLPSPFGEGSGERLCRGCIQAVPGAFQVVMGILSAS